MRNYKKEKIKFRNPIARGIGLLLTVICLTLFQYSGYGQSKTVSGAVKEKSGNVLPGVTVVIKGTSQGTSTDFDGKFSLNVEENSVLVFSFIGFKSQEVVVAGKSKIDLVLYPDVESIEEVVVTGYSSQSKATVTTSIEQVDAEPLQNVPAGGNAVNALIGKVSGVSIVQSDGRSGSAPAIQIRGGTTPGFGGDKPLYIVDGFVQGDIGAIDMNDVEEFTILKDAAATAIYGAQAANGVIIVKTRQGKKGKFNVQFKYAHEFQSAERYKVDVLTPEEELYYLRLGTLNYEGSLAYQFIQGRPHWYSSVQPYSPEQSGYNENAASQLYWLDDVLTYNNGVVPEGYVQTVDPVTGRQMVYPVNDWQDAIFTNGSGDTYFLNIGGGTEKATYSVSMSYYDVSGIGVFNDYQRYYLNANTDIQLSKKVKAGFKFNYSLEDENRGEGNTWYERSARQAVTTRLFNDDGSPASNIKNSGKWNPKFYETNLLRERINTDMRINAYMEWEILDGLKFKPSVMVRQYGSNFASFIYENEIQGTKRSQSAFQTNDLHTQFDGILTYKKVFDDAHSVNILAGTSFRNTYAYDIEGTAFGAASDLIPVIIDDIPNENTTVETAYGKTAIQSWFGQVSYDYKKRYLLNATLRYDGNYRFTEENKWGTFPGISAGWNIHKENFWGNLGMPWFRKAKVTASYGEAGKSSGLSINDTRGAYSTVSYANAGGVLQSNLQNTSLVWETTREWVGGLDMTFFEGNKLNASIQYYDRAAVDRLFLEPLPAFTGFSGIRTNIGTFASRGLEFTFDANLVNTDKFAWDVSGFFDYLMTQKTLKLPVNGADKNRIGGTNITNPNDPSGDPLLVGGYAEGERWGGIYGYVNDGIIQNWDEADVYNAKIYDEISASSRNKRQFKKPGDVMWRDLNGDGLINSMDREFKGWATPDKRLGLTTSFHYKNENVGLFKLSVTLESSLGAVAYDWHTMRMISQAQGGDRPSVVVRDSWLEEGDNLYGRYQWANRHTSWNFERNAEPWMQSADYLALRNIEFKYSLPKTMANLIGLSDVSAYVSGQNLGYLTDYKGPDPSQVDGNDKLGSVPPAPLTISFGLDVKF
ncbi:SusC/RagA family TonB-linked outer membrane protein [Puteibacter caeruleilacunae]|nr:SusC/RagA family TonB-linked outer membrane protein [Puteibacter caeruleilacunae]